LTARAELDGLGPADGPIITWTVPEDFAQAEPQGTLPFDWMPGSATGSWLGFLCLLLVVVLLLIRTSSKDPPPATPRAR
jgi:hypothetical protein